MYTELTNLNTTAVTTVTLANTIKDLAIYVLATCNNCLHSICPVQASNLGMEGHRNFKYGKKYSPQNIIITDTTIMEADKLKVNVTIAHVKHKHKFWYAMMAVKPFNCSNITH